MLFNCEQGTLTEGEGSVQLISSKYTQKVFKAADFNYLEQGGQLYWAFLFSKDSLL